MTSDEPALIDAIIANPADDTPRLAYADWLEENAGTVKCDRCVITVAEKIRVWGERAKPCPNCLDSEFISDGRKERAEFIRVQVELARLPTIDQCGHIDDHRRASELRDRIQKLWDIGTNCGGFLELPAHWGIPYWRRGFVESTKLSWSDWSQHAAAILRAKPIERVRLTTRPEVLFTADPGREYVQTARFADSPTSYRFKLAGRRTVDGEEPLVEAARDEPLGTWMLREMLLRRWPRIEFELPPARGINANDIGELVNTTLRELGRMRFRDLVAAENR